MDLRGAVHDTDQHAMTVGSYDVICHIAAGGMGTVYLCRRAGQGGFQRLFALKVMHPHLAEDEGFVQMLLDEARLAARLHHPNVVSIVDIGQHAVGYFLVMDYVEGCTLGQLLKRNPDNRPPGLIVPIMMDMLQGLHAAHTLNDDQGKPLHLVHRDVSPQNVLIGVDGTARLTDFGIAKAEARISHTMVGVRKGKLEYMSPEQITCLADLDHRGDIFSAGVLLWNALTGQRLFKGADADETTRNVLGLEIAPPSKVKEGMPDVFDAVVLKALERDRDRRYSSAAEMAAALRSAALKAGMLEPASSVAAWVLSTFEAELNARRGAIVEAAARDKVVRVEIQDGVLAMPQITGSFPIIPSLTPSSTAPGGTPSQIVPTRLGKEAARRRLLLAVVGVVLAGALVGVAFLAGRSPTEGHRPDRSGRPAAAAAAPAPAPAAAPTPAVTPTPAASSAPSAPETTPVAAAPADSPSKSPRRRPGRPTKVATPAAPAPPPTEAAPRAPDPTPPATPTTGSAPGGQIERNPYLRRR